MLGADANLKNFNDLEAGEEAGDALKTDSNSDEEEESQVSYYTVDAETGVVLRKMVKKS